GVIRQLGAIQAYKNEHPESVEAIAYVLAAAQGPKGVAQFIAMKAVEGTEAGQAISENIDKANAFVGQKVAQIVEGTELNPTYDSDKFLIGGGELLSSILFGAMPARKGEGAKRTDKGKAPYTSTVSTDAEAGMPYAHPVKGAGAKEVPAVKWSAQEKHFPGHNSYTPGRSVLSSDPRKLAESAGTGQQVGNIPVGMPGSKERVNFGGPIGTYIDGAGVATPTANGIIHYSKDGIHIVPARP
ncbi:polymorphic toxin type 50 domain-containing protein, partial [Pseudomonas khavaziana]|uniref:polymorphic toxin type 50 domain-containing protein n=1 Tax=Pseudomonas khavaziana TaxID=2842351 RepID=UPI00202BC003